jgi:hypothetical protein
VSALQQRAIFALDNDWYWAVDSLHLTKNR